MASINKLSIRGVRSFSATDEEQVIEFGYPVTIILGANGCGKTTIIETLKYAMTGSLPPGNKSGQAFVNDPKSCGQSNVKAMIKLRFTNRAGHSMVVIRSMEVTQKKTTLSFKALDGVLRTQDQNTGERVSMSHKCTELDRQIPALMGVSKAILEHVVFCHQEDSSWPLQEGAVLKKRFDEIFDSTRYVKALEAIRKTKLEYTGISKEKKGDLTGLESHKYAASGFRKEMEDCTDKLDTLKIEYDTFTEGIEKEDKTQEELEFQLNDVKIAQNKIMTLEQQVDKARTNASMRKSHLDSDLTSKHTLLQLKTNLVSHENSKSKSHEEYEEMDNLIFQKKDDVTACNRKISDYRERRGIVSSQIQNLDNLIKKRWNVIQDISKKYDLPIPEELLLGGGSSTQPATSTNNPECYRQEDVQTFLSSLDEYQKNIQSKLNIKQKERQEIEDKLQNEIGKLDSEKMTVETDSKRLNTKIKDAKRELQSISHYGSHGGAESQYSTITAYTNTYSTKVTKKDVEDAKIDIDNSTDHFKRISTDPKLQTIPRDIKKYEEKSKKVQHEIEEEREVLSDLRQIAEEQTKINSMKADIQRDIGILKDVPNRNEYLWKKKDYESLLPDTNNFDINQLQETSNKIAALVHDNKTKLDALSKECSKKEKDISVKKALFDTLNKEKHTMKSQISKLFNDNNGGIKKIERVIKSIRQFETEATDGTNIPTNIDPQELLNYIDAELKELNEGEVADDGVVNVVKLLQKMAKVRDDNGTVIRNVCPCCDREMNDNENGVFKQTIKALGNINTSKLVRQNKAFYAKQNSEKANFERWRGLVYNSMDDWKLCDRLQAELKEKEEIMSNDKIETENLTREIERLRPKLEDHESKNNELQILVQESCQMCNDAQRISAKQNELRTLQNRIDVPSNAGGRDVRELEESLQSKSDEKDNIMAKREKYNKDLMSLNQRVLNAQKELKEKEEIFREKEAKYEKDQEMNRRRAELGDMLENYYEEDKNLTQKISPLESQLVSKKNERERVRREFKVELDELNKSYNNFNRDKFLIQNLNNQIEQSEKSCNREDLSRLAEKMSALESNICSMREEIEELEPQLESIKQKMTQGERYEKNLHGNIELLQELEELKVLEEQLEMETKECEVMNSSSANLQEQYDSSMRRKRKQEDAKARVEGRVYSLKEQVKILRHKLRTAEYKDIDERTRVAMIEYETTILAIQDLDNYWTALDKALLQYHRLKIEDINKIIRELWSLTYKGLDISNIEIVSGQESGSRAARSYNYRVVMTKGGMTKMDMRGRCSAGQRVLASIVIRLALAETFCLNCGVMTLDEPTTNLDYENKRGLAIALAQIITARSSQQNFQLVTITHDEDFVAMMKNELSSQTSFDMPERYFQVSREEANDGKHYSKINAVDWDSI